MPDILVCPGDVAFIPSKPSQKRVEKAADRTTLWMKEVLLLKQECGNDNEKLPSHIFAPILPVPWEQQKWYAELLAEDQFRPLVAGLSIYDVHAFQNPPEAFSNLPRLSLTQPASPNEVLKQIWLGMDLLVIPFIGASTVGTLRTLPICYLSEKVANATRARNIIALSCSIFSMRRRCWVGCCCRSIIIV